MFGVKVSDCGELVFLSIVDSCDPINKLFYFRLADFTGGAFDADKHVVKLVDNFKAGFTYITNDGARVLLETNLNAPRTKIVAIDLKAASEASAAAGGAGDAATDAVLTLAKDVVPEHAQGGVLDGVELSHGKLVLSHTVDVCTQLSVYTLDGVVDTSVDFSFLPKFSSLMVLGKSKSPELSIYVTNMLHAGSAFVFDMATGEHAVFKDSNPAGFDADKFTVEQIFYPSVDGTKIPMFLMHKKGLVKTGTSPTYLYGYGGFGITLSPSFSINRWMWAEHFDGIAVVANLRGGGEYGEEAWHKAGCHDKKQNVFDDFYSAAKYLVDNNYTSYRNIGIHGGSNGGLLVAASVNQRPEKFGAAVAAVGVLDMLRFHKFTIGNAWCSDYGCSEETPKQFESLRAYSPVHTVPAPEKAALPAVMLTTADHDDRVVPLHSFKYIAEAQRLHGFTGPGVAAPVSAALAANTLDKAPVVIRIETNAGHGAGKPLNKVIDEHADVFGFFAKHLGAKWVA
jgi:prolyl oligopeptidase